MKHFQQSNRKGYHNSAQHSENGNSMGGTGSKQTSDATPHRGICYFFLLALLAQNGTIPKFSKTAVWCQDVEFKSLQLIWFCVSI